MVNKIKIIIISILIIIFAAFSLLFYVRKSGKELFGGWVSAYDSSDDVAANTFAEKMRLLNGQESAFYLAHMAVSDTINMSGQAKMSRLSTALNELENERFSFFVSNQRPIVMLKATISALMGEKDRAVGYALDACKLNRPMPLEDCLNGPLSFDDPGGSRWMALQYYENAILYNAIGTGEKDRSIFYEAVSLKYFNVEKANVLLKVLISEKKLTLEMRAIYCNPLSPVDVSVCSKE